MKTYYLVKNYYLDIPLAFEDEEIAKIVGKDVGEFGDCVFPKKVYVFESHEEYLSFEEKRKLDIARGKLTGEEINLLEEDFFKKTTGFNIS